MFKSALIALGVVTSIFLMFFISLINGISINNISNESVNINGLYLKYDKKLIFSIKKLEVFESKEESEPATFEPEYIYYINSALNYFKLIQIDEIIIGKGKLSLKYENQQLLIKNKQLELIFTHTIKDDTLNFNLKTNKIKDLSFINDYTTLSPEVSKLLNEQLKFDYIQLQTLNGKHKISDIGNFGLDSLNLDATVQDIVLNYESYPTLSLKAIDINLAKGIVTIDTSKTNEQTHQTLLSKVTVDLKEDKQNIKTTYFYKDIELYIDALINKGIINYEISSNRFSTLNTVNEIVPFPLAIKKWAIDRLNSNGVQINSVSGKDVVLEKFVQDLSHLKINATLYDIDMDFNPKRAYPLNAKKVDIYFDGKDMNLKLTKPYSNDVDLEGSDAVIYDMLGDKAGLLLRLQSISPLNWTLVRSVKSYDVNIADELGVRQTKGDSDIKVKIDIPFTDNPVDVYVSIKNKNSTIKVKDNPLDFEKFDFLYKDKKVIITNSTLLHENYKVLIKDMLFDIKKNSLNLKLNAKDINNTIDVDLTNYTNLDKNITNGAIDINKVYIKDLSDIKNKNIPYNASFGKDIDAQIPKLGFSFVKKNDTNSIKLKELKKFEEFIIPLSQANLKTSSLNIKTDDFKKLDIHLNALSKDNKPELFYDIDIYSKVNLDTNITKGDVVLNKLVANSYKFNDTKIPYIVKTNKDLKVQLPSLDLNYSKKDDNNIIEVKSFEKITKLLNILQDQNITKSSAVVTTKDFKDIQAKLNLYLESYLVYHKNKKLNNLTLDVDINEQKEIKVTNKYQIIDAKVQLKDALKVELTTNDLGLAYKSIDTNETKEEPAPKKYGECKNIPFDLPLVKTTLNNGFFQFNENKLEYDKINTFTNKNKLQLNLDKNVTKLNILLEKDRVNIYANKLNSAFLNNLANREISDKGNISFNITGTQCDMDINANIDSLNIKDAKILNNIFIVVNSAPAIINPLLILPNAYRFATDGFNLSEYEIEKGNINLNVDRNKQTIDITKADIKGVHSDFKLKGDIELVKEQIDAKIDIIFMKDYAGIINYIPLVNYVLLGEDKRFSYSADIKGKLTDPKVTTHLTKETLMAPVNIIKRVFLLPTLPFQDDEETK